MSEEAHKPEGEADAVAAKKSKLKDNKLALILVVLVVMLLGVIGGGVVYITKLKKLSDPTAVEEAHNAEMDKEKHHKRDEARKKSDEKKKKEHPPIYIELEAFTVNLKADESGEHFLQTKISLRLSDSHFEGEIKSHMPEIRSRLVLLLSSKTAGSVISVEGKARLAEEIALQVNSVVDPQAAKLYKAIGDMKSQGGGHSAKTGHGDHNLNSADDFNEEDIDLPVHAVLFSSFIMQ